MQSEVVAAAPRPSHEEERGDPVLKRVGMALRNLRFGSVEIHLHEGQVVKIIRTEKLRIE